MSSRLECLVSNLSLADGKVNFNIIDRKTIKWGIIIVGDTDE